MPLPLRAGRCHDAPLTSTTGAEHDNRTTDRRRDHRAGTRPLDRWGKGDPSGYLEISVPEATYFDPYLPRRLDGHKALAEWYAPLRGTIHIDRYEMIDPKVQLAGEVAVLNFNLASHSGATAMNWNCTEVYRRYGEGWRITHTHWSVTQHLNN